ncbi:MAG: dockerin type I domain-containing protein [Phycisphaerales bacterium]
MFNLSGSGLAVAAAAMLVSASAEADFTVDLGSGNLAGNQTRFVDVEVTEAMMPPGQVMIGFEFSMDYVAGPGVEWASDMGLWINDADGRPSVQIGGYNILFADIQGPDWSFYGLPFSGPYSDAQPLTHSGIGTWRIWIGNAWTGAAAVGYNDVTLTVIVGEAGACATSTESCDQPHKDPGCSDAVCCGLVCDFDPTCCEIAWDGFCAAYAIDLCGIYQYECPAGGPANNCPTNATPILDGDVLPFNTTDADPVAPLSDCQTEATLGPDVWFQYCATESGAVTFSGCGQTDYDQKMRAYNIGDGVFDPNLLPAMEIACDDDGCTGTPASASKITVQVIAGNCYLFAVGGFAGAVGSGTVSLEYIPAYSCGDPAAGSCCDPDPLGLGFCDDADCCATVCNIDPTCCELSWDVPCANLAYQNCPKLCDAQDNDDCSGAAEVFAGVNSVATYNATTGSIQPPADGCTFYGQSTIFNDTWYVYESNCEGFLTFSFCQEEGGSANWDTKMAVWTGTDCGDLVIAGCNDDACDPLSSQVNVEAVCGVTYWIQIGGYNGNQYGSGTLAINCGGKTCGDPPIPGDLNGDGVVNGADLAIMLGCWGPVTSPACAAADIDDDGVVTGADLATLLGNWSS